MKRVKFVLHATSLTREFFSAIVWDDGTFVRLDDASQAPKSQTLNAAAPGDTERETWERRGWQVIEL